MGGAPLTALSIIGFPVHDLPGKVMHDILRGGIDKMKEAGIAVIGGHSINDGEIKCGFAVVGTCKKDSFIRNSGAEIGDVLVLTKPLGVGIAAFAAQIGRADTTTVEQIAASMASLNKTAAELMVTHNAHAATDVTGFSLLGHLSEIVKNSRIQVEINFDAIPVFCGVADLARMEILPGAVERNREAVPVDLLDFTNVEKAQENILFGPETSGGLLISLSEKDADEYIRDIRDSGNTIATVIGRITDNHNEGKIIVTSSMPNSFTPMAIPEKDNCCCCDTEPAQENCCDSEDQAQTADESCCCCSKG
jgi:selenide,water dikinase